MQQREGEGTSQEQWVLVYGLLYGLRSLTGSGMKRGHGPRVSTLLYRAVSQSQPLFVILFWEFFGRHEGTGIMLRVANALVCASSLFRCTRKAFRVALQVSSFD